MDRGEPSGVSILLIEDDARLRTTLTKLFEQAGYSVEEAEEGAEGLRRYRARPAEVVITDLLMPGMEGMETIRRLRALEPAPRIIAISGGGRVRAAEYLPVAQVTGADRTIEKPFRFEELLELVRQLQARTPAAPAPGIAPPDEDQRL